MHATPASPVTLPPLALAASAGASATVSAGSGCQADAQDTVAAVMVIAGCARPFVWDVEDAQIPVSRYTASAAATAR